MAKGHRQQGLGLALAALALAAHQELLEKRQTSFSLLLFLSFRIFLLCKRPFKWFFDAYLLWRRGSLDLEFVVEASLTDAPAAVISKIQVA